MTSWGPGFPKPKGIQTLPYYHMTGFGSYAEEFFEICVSAIYAQDTNNFLFVFDMINSIGSDFLLFQNTLKKNSFLRFLPYYPTTGFNIKDRKDLTKPIVLRAPLPDKDDIYRIAPKIFDLQDKIREKNNLFFERYELQQQEYAAVICVSPNREDPEPYLQAAQFLPREPLTLYVVCSSLNTLERFQKVFPSCWKLESIHQTKELHTQTQEQKIQRLLLEIGELQRLRFAPHVIGTFDDIRCRVIGLLEKRFRETGLSFHAIDGKFFSLFPTN